MAPRSGGSGLVAQRDRLLGAVAPIVAGAGYDLEELTVAQAGRRRVVRVMVDADGGVGLDAIAELSRGISAALDDQEGADGSFGSAPYTLEVTSPGVDRPLTEPRHWRRNVGRLVRVRVGERSVTGRVLAADEAGVEFDVAGHRHRHTHAELGPGKVQVEFNRPDGDTGHGAGSGKEES